MDFILCVQTCFQQSSNLAVLRIDLLSISIGQYVANYSINDGVSVYIGIYILKLAAGY